MLQQGSNCDLSFPTVATQSTELLGLVEVRHYVNKPKVNDSEIIKESTHKAIYNFSSANVLEM